MEAGAFFHSWQRRTNLWRERTNLRTGSDSLTGVANDRPTADVRSHAPVVPPVFGFRVGAGSVRYILMKKTLLAGIAVLSMLSASAAHAGQRAHVVVGKPKIVYATIRGAMFRRRNTTSHMMVS